jgi:hypothetical protein
MATSITPSELRLHTKIYLDKVDKNELVLVVRRGVIYQISKYAS